ncbi:MAG: Sec-independent protein translocase protein TatB [Woeseia sp.]
MSGIGFWELIILFLIGLIVLGPERLPRVANQLGTWLGQARRMTRVMKRQLEDELNLEEQMRLKPPSTPQIEEDDTFSPAHDKDSVGSGVGDDGKVSDHAPSQVEGPVEAPDTEPSKETS